MSKNVSLAPCRAKFTSAHISERLFKRSEYLEHEIDEILQAEIWLSSSCESVAPSHLSLTFSPLSLPLTDVISSVSSWWVTHHSQYAVQLQAVGRRWSEYAPWKYHLDICCAIFRKLTDSPGSQGSQLWCAESRCLGCYCWNVSSRFLALIVLFSLLLLKWAVVRCAAPNH